MKQKRSILFAAVVASMASIAPHSSSAQECDGDYYAGIGANQHYTGSKRQPTNAYLLKHRTNQQQPPRPSDDAGNRSPG
ncbi:hypothetical protein LAC79_32275 [Ensifer adhaerens]|uniref:hypothetical protein n=1 Tax=Ensifer adhaerens TaxID=106592 RepID=UPI001CC0803C|nr:hypothetical protein [Ensifer adhaerens]MBZ7926452.1 hypothetical protein [Ensifer adhaerens]UAX97198.1 hypothetical protein LAC78_26050 [Ensifer adhaerens]